MVPCTRSFVVTCQRVYRTVCIFYLALSSTALQVGGESYLTPFLSWCVQHSFHLPISGFCFCFLMCVVQHLVLSKKYLGLCSVLGGFTLVFCFNRSWGRLRSCRRTWLQFPSDLALRLCPNIFGVLISCYWVFKILQTRCPCGGFVVFSSLLLPAWRGSKVLRGTVSWLRVMSREVFSLTSIIIIILRRSYWWGVFPSLWQDFLCIRLSYYSVE